MKANLKIALRNLYREKTYALINIAGLALAVCCCLIVALYLRNELGYDRHHLQHERIFRVVNEFTVAGSATSFAMTSRSLGPMLKEEYPEVLDYVRFIRTGTMLVRHGDQAFYWDRNYVVTDNIFKVFTHAVLYGDPEKALADGNSIAVSESFARKYFGNTNPIGKILDFESGASRRIDLVFADLPDNTHLQYEMLLSANQDRFRMPEDMTERRRQLMSVNDYTYLLMPPGYRAEDFEAISSDFAARHVAEVAKEFQIEGGWRAWLQPLADIHLYSDIGYDLPTGNRFYIFGFAAVGLFILLIACINYVNLATARATKRAKTIAIRKIIGASRGSLALQFLGESLFFALTALLLGIVLTELVLTLSPLNSLIGKQLSLDLASEPRLLLWILAAGLMIGLLSGLYPALYLSSWSPLTAMIGRYKASASSARFRQGLVFLQFTVSVAVIAATLLMLAQMQYIQSKSLGFGKENRLLMTLHGADLIESVPTLRTELMTNPQVLGATTAANVVGVQVGTSLMRVESHDGALTDQEIKVEFVGDHYLETMGMRLVAGRDFSLAQPSDIQNSVIVNQSLVRKMGWSDPIGKQLRQIEPSDPRRVIGVVEDFNYASLHSPIEPMALLPLDEARSLGGRSAIDRRIAQRIMVINIAGEQVSETLAFLEQKFSEFDPSHPFAFRFLEDSLNDHYLSEQQAMKLVGIFAALCILIACMGLFGLAVFTTEQRTKEIGIRKTLGATTGQIILLLSRNIFALVVGGALFASVIAYLAIDEWLAGFAYRAPINPMIFVIATLITALVAYITIVLQSYKTASADPVGSLRYE